MVSKHSKMKRSKKGGRDAAGYVSSMYGDLNQQFNGVFGPQNTSQSNVIQLLKGGYKKAKKMTKKMTRNKKGGFLGQILNQAIVPFAILGLQQTFRKKNNKNKNYTRKNRK